MTLTVLVSFSFLALVVTARPINNPVQGSSLIDPKHTADVQDAIQALFQSHTGLAPRPDEDIQVHLTSPSEQQAYLAQLQELDINAVKAIVPVQDDEERKLYEALGGTLDDLDGGVRTPNSDQEELEGVLQKLDGEEVQEKVAEAETQPERPSESYHGPLTTPSDPPALLLAVLSVATSLVAWGVISLGLYVLRRCGWISKMGTVSEEDEEKGLGGNSGDKAVAVDEKDLIVEKLLTEDNTKSVITTSPLTEKTSSEVEIINEKGGDLITFQESTEKLPSSASASDSESESEDPKIIIDSPDAPSQPAEQHADPDLLPLPQPNSPSSNTSLSLSPSPSPSPSTRLSPLPQTQTQTQNQTPPRSPSRRPLQMREVPLSSSPAWAALASASVSNLDLPIPGAMPMPVLDRRPQMKPEQMQVVGGGAVLPMADPAWLVRLLVQALWGWMAVFVGGAR